MGTKLKLLAGIGVGMGIRVAGRVGDGYKYLSPCSSAVHTDYLELKAMKLLLACHRLSDLMV